jgi:hypothetical protein
MLRLRSRSISLCEAREESAFMKLHLKSASVMDKSGTRIVLGQAENIRKLADYWNKCTEKQVDY